MRISELGVSKRANVILGAGASRGASCFENLWASAPLDTDFFEQVERLRNTSDGKSLGKLVEFARKEFGTDLPRMELFFTQVESLSAFHDSLKIDRGPRVRQYEQVLAHFTSDLATVFRCLRSLSGNADLRCDYHDCLAGSLRAGDTVLSFNYDSIIDESLKAMCGKSWDASKGYGVDVSKGDDRWHDHSGRGKKAKHSIKLLKLHGSLNWDRSNANNAVELRDDPYADVDRFDREVVPPVWNKGIGEDGIYPNVWKQARSSLREGPILVLIGYSIPDTDLLSQSLLRVATSEGNKRLSHLVIVNPDSAARAKTKQVLRQALTEKSIVIEFSYLSELAQVL